MTAPLVTAVIPAFNSATTIRRAVESVLVQTYGNREIIVVDDASTDATADIVASHYGDRVRLLRSLRNQGASGATNDGIAAAKGALIAFLDADDEWLPDKLARQVAVLDSSPDVVMVASGCRFVSGSGEVGSDAGIFAFDVPPGEIWRLLLAATLIAKPCVMARTATLRTVGLFDTSLAVGEDQDMWIRLALAGGVAFVPEILTLVHDTAGSLTKLHADKADRYVLPMIRRHIEEQRHRLSRREVRGILGARYTTVGRTIYAAGSPVRGARLLLGAVFLGHCVGTNLWYLITASPALKAAKRQVRRTGAAAGGHGQGRKSRV